MEMIGEGLQYRVYTDEENVKKEPKSRFEMAIKLLGWNSFLGLKPWELASRTNEVYKDREKSLEWVQGTDFPLEKLGNPSVNGNSLEQERLTPLDSIDNPDPQKVVEGYVENVREMWRHGAMEKTFNLIQNYGFSDEILVLHDFGELIYEKDEAAELLEQEAWKSWDYRNLMDEELQSRYAKAHRERLTSGNLEKYWAEELET